MLVTEWVVKKTIRKTEFLKGEGIGGSVFPIPFSPLLYWFYKYLCGWKCYLSVGFFRVSLAWMPGGRGLFRADEGGGAESCRPETAAAENKEQTKERITKTWYLNVPGYNLRNSTHVPAV